MQNHKSLSLVNLVPNTVVDKALFYGMLVLILASIAIVVRVERFGLRLHDVGNFFLILSSFAIVIFRKQISLNKKIIVISILATFAAFIGLYNLGLMAGAILCLPLTAILLSLCFSSLVVIGFCSLSLIVLSLFGVAHVAQKITLTIPYEILTISGSHWIAYILSIAIFYTITCFLIFSYRAKVTTLLSKLEQANNEICMLKYFPEENGDFRSEASFRVLEENCPEPICILNLNRYLYVNSAWQKMMGYRREEARTLQPALLVHPDMGDEILQRGTRRLRGEQVNNRYEMKCISKHGETFWIDFSAINIKFGGEDSILAICKDITDQKVLEYEREKLIVELQEAISEIKTLRGIIPICSYCKKIRDDSGYWGQVEEYITQRTEAQFSHTICIDCEQLLYEEMGLDPED